MRHFRFSLVTLFCIFCLAARGGGKFTYYFNHTVDNSVSTGVNAVNLNGYIDDTLVAYINRAKYTLDIAVYNFSASSSSLGNVATAINNAYTRGVKVRWIKDGGQSNSGLGLINSAIPVLGSPTSSSYTIMHNKFMIVDAGSTNPNDAVVWTGSTNWSGYQFNDDYDNIVIVQDSGLAHAYLDEFNMMWGGTGMTPVPANSKFGHTKTDLGRHNFTIDGKQVELYFSPSDNTGSHIQSAIASADKDAYFGMYTFTYTSFANALVAKKNAGVYVAGIMDTFSHGFSPYSILSGGLGSNFKEYDGGGTIYHNKYLIVDPSDKCSDPLVLTGSHNWSSSANTDNDENTLIIHDATAANIYYQSFKADFAAMGGTLTPITGCPTEVAGLDAAGKELSIYPNPSNGEFNLSFYNEQPSNVVVTMSSIDGRTSEVLYDVYAEQGLFKGSVSEHTPGLYILRIVSKNTFFTKQLIIQ